MCGVVKPLHGERGTVGRMQPLMPALEMRAVEVE